jgi:hypothetical protein
VVPNKNADHDRLPEERDTYMETFILPLNPPLPPIPPTFPGKDISFGLAQQCMLYYASTMAQHGIIYPLQPIDIRITNGREVTYSEFFDGDGVIEWLNKKIDALKLQYPGAPIQTRLVLGMYPRYLHDQFKTEVPEIDMEPKFERTTIFVIPYAVVDSRLAPPDRVYDFGGLQP